jgi:hypothetical protein
MKRTIDPRRIEVMDDAVADALRTLQPYEKVALVAQAFEVVRGLVRDKLRMENPSWSDDQVQREVVRAISSGLIPFDARPAIRDGVLVMVAFEIEPEPLAPPPRRRPYAEPIPDIVVSVEDRASGAA